MPNSELSTRFIRRALTYLRLNLSIEQETRLIDYMKDSFQQKNCIVLCKKLPSGKFLESLGIDIGNQELVIKENQQIFYSHTYVVPVHKVS